MGESERRRVEALLRIESANFWRRKKVYIVIEKRDYEGTWI